LPSVSAVTAASSATGISLVPPVATTIARAGFRRRFAHDADAGRLEIPERGMKEKQLCRFGGKPCNQKRLRIAGKQLVCNRLDLLRRLARAVDDLRNALPERAVMIDLGKAKVRKRLHLQLECRFLDGNGTRFYLAKQFFDFLTIHGRLLKNLI